MCSKENIQLKKRCNMAKNSKKIKTADLLRDILKNSIGTLMIEMDKWKFPEYEVKTPFGRGSFNDRLKFKDAINEKCRENLLYMFSHLFSPETLNGNIGEKDAVKGANALIDVFKTYFKVDLSFWKNSYAADNRQKREHILHCLENVLTICIDEEYINVQVVQEFFENYLAQISELEQLYNEKPDYLGSLPYQQADCFIGRENIVEDAFNDLMSCQSVYLYGIGGIGKTEIAKAVYLKFRNLPKATSGITHIMWLDYIENSFEFSLVRALGMDEHNISLSYNKARNLINSYGNRLLMIIDNVENANDSSLLKISNYFNCRILITSRCEGFNHLRKIEITALDRQMCRDLFAHYYHGTADVTSMDKIIELADNHTVTIGLLSKIADTAELTLSDFLQTLIECGFNISEEVASTVHEKMQSEDRIIEQLKKLFRVLSRTFEIYPVVLHEKAQQFITAFDTLCDILCLQGEYENALYAANKALKLFMENNYTDTDEEVIQYKGKIREIENIIKYAERD